MGAGGERVERKQPGGRQIQAKGKHKEAKYGLLMGLGAPWVTKRGECYWPWRSHTRCTEAAKPDPEPPGQMGKILNFSRSPQPGRNLLSRSDGEERIIFSSESSALHHL